MVAKEKTSRSLAFRILKDSSWSGASHLAIAITGLINTAMVAHLGTKAVLVTAAVQLITFIYMSVDGGCRNVIGPLIAQCTSKELKNLPPSLDKQKNKLMERQKVQSVVVQSVYLSLQLAMPLMMLVFLIPETLLTVFGAKTAISSEAIRYCQLMLGTILLNSIASMCDNTLRNIGETKVLAHGSTLRLSFHIIPGAIGVYILNWGLTGVAGSAIAGQLAGLSYLGYHVKKKVFHELLTPLNFDWKLQWHTIQSSLPLIIDLLLFFGNEAVFWYILQDYNENVLAAHRIAESILSIPAALMIGFNTTVTREIGMAYGDDDANRIKRVTSIAIFIVFCVAVVLYSSSALFAPWITYPFTNGSTTINKLIQNGSGFS
jgi:Na+-driven multidrug efflux pump